ncbi:tyrosine-type recombinase/integrase [Mesorhizobium sp. M1409]|uniref:tyrosine-type recombinase/integrase n=1 Tax=Mesorhizobium sp. M1409 TaxID=2957100 RepID=UPI003335EC0A
MNMELNISDLQPALKAYLKGEPHRLMGTNKETGLPTRVRYSVADCRNLYLSVTASGAMSWVFLKVRDGKQREMGLGSLAGGTNLQLARLKADKARLDVASGLDPIAQKKAAKTADATFEDMFKRTIKLHEDVWKTKNGVNGQRKDWEDKVNLHCAKLLKMRVADVGLDQVEMALEPIWKTKPTTADRVRYIINTVIETAMSEGIYKGKNPASKETVEGKLGRRAQKAVKNQPALAYAKLPAAIATLLATGRITAKASVFCTLTATRSDEARLMRWEEVNFAKRMWTVPAERMKVLKASDRGGDHLVPLSDAALAILTELKQIADPSNPYVFAGEKKGQPIAQGSLNVVISAKKAKGGILQLAGSATQHGMRATFRTWGGEEGYDRDALELSLAHTIGKGETERAYYRPEMIAKRTKIMQAWGEYCMGREALKGEANDNAKNEVAA